ncbi:Spondin-2 [Eumeta japonica]|uniref:Spondin-2 n=1 Tax=Eumeta variegata TaxID=151549 RepID=A0A4C1WNL0_EUMVA|nr:Spondin-2 [Eumeta japonica]
MQVSVMTRMIPSPDWFIGVDGFDLCVDGNWLDSITIENVFTIARARRLLAPHEVLINFLTWQRPVVRRAHQVEPLDAGTDNGFTFTAPNWPTAPQGVAYRITARYPAHPAGSFFYPHLRRLPPIATFQFIKVSMRGFGTPCNRFRFSPRCQIYRLRRQMVGIGNIDRIRIEDREPLLREYELTEVFHRTSDERRYDVLQLDRLAHNSIDVLDGNRALAVAEEAERAEQAPGVYVDGRMTTADASYSYYSIGPWEPRDDNVVVISQEKKTIRHKRRDPFRSARVRGFVPLIRRFGGPLTVLPYVITFSYFGGVTHSARHRPTKTASCIDIVVHE